MTMQTISADSTAKIFKLLKGNEATMRATTAKERIQKLKMLRASILKHRPEIKQAMLETFAKPELESDISEVYPIIVHIDFVIKNLAEWMRPKWVPTIKELWPADSHINHEPKGTILIISPWNYPFILTIDPLVSAIAAGNTAVIKPSELCPATIPVLRKIIGEVFDANEVQIIEGGVEMTTELMKLPFNHVFFTGSPRVGKIIMKQAAEHLASITLELGGKSPAIVHEDANISLAAQRIVFGKFLNAGQTCVAPDMIYVHEKVAEQFERECIKWITKQFGNSNELERKPADIAVIINNSHFERITGLIADAVSHGASLLCGGHSNPNTRYIAPTLLSNIDPDSQILQEEIFGPVLPILRYQDMDQLIVELNTTEKPLALYLFSSSTSIQKKVMNETSAGGVTINDCLIHQTNPNLPFGGVNNSGIGKSRGHLGFVEFSNIKPVMRASQFISYAQLIGPPYTNFKKKLIDFGLKWL